MSSTLGTKILQIVPVLLENSSYIIPEKKLQSLLSHATQVLCSEDPSSIVYNSTLACYQQVHSQLFQFTRIRSWWRWANTLLPSAKNIPRTPPARSTTAFAKKLPKPSVRMSTALSTGILSRTCVRAFKTKMLLG